MLASPALIDRNNFPVHATGLAPILRIVSARSRWKIYISNAIDLFRLINHNHAHGIKLEQFEPMKITRTTLLLCCLFVFEQSIQASAPSGYVIEWGRRDTFTGTPVSTQVVLSNAVAISAGRMQCLALKDDGTVDAWSWNRKGEITFDNNVQSSAGGIDGKTFITTRIITNGVVKINGQVLTNSVSIAAGDGFSLALRKDGTIVAWGEQEPIETVSTLPDNNAERSSMKIDPVTGLLVQTKDNTMPNNFRVGIARDGTVVTRVEDKEPTPFGNVIAIAAAGFTSIAVKGDGTVVEWESEGSLPQHGQLRVVPGLTNVISVAIGEAYQGTRPVALKKDGTVANWGTESIYNDATPPAGLSNVVAIAAGSNHSLALKSDGTVVGWGWNKVGEATGTPTINSPNGLDFFAVGQVQIRGQTLSNVVSIAAGPGYSLALKKDGTITAWGRMVNDLYPAYVPGDLSNVIAIAAGDNYCLAITTNKAVADKFRQK
jgi:alpha-tubulin suppressor-like RCC1 family protein